jgi:hypothetical protein
MRQAGHRAGSNHARAGADQEYDVRRPGEAKSLQELAGHRRIMDAISSPPGGAPNR